MTGWRGKRLAIALGGNALLRRGESPDIEAQQHDVRTAAQSIDRVAGDIRIVLTHGNGPQVGLLALQAEACRDARPYPLDLLGAESEGMIGYLVEEELRNELPGHDIATLLTHVIVNPTDPAFEKPSKPIGPAYSKAIPRTSQCPEVGQSAPTGDAGVGWSLLASRGGSSRSAPFACSSRPG
jgi:carbamate kinase